MPTDNQDPIGFDGIWIGAAGETRTLNPLREPASKAGVYTSSTTAAQAWQTGLSLPEENAFFKPGYFCGFFGKAWCLFHVDSRAKEDRKSVV